MVPPQIETKPLGIMVRVIMTISIEYLWLFEDLCLLTHILVQIMQNYDVAHLLGNGQVCVDIVVLLYARPRVKQTNQMFTHHAGNQHSVTTTRTPTSLTSVQHGHAEVQVRVASRCYESI